MYVEITAATLHEHDTLFRNLWQFYIYEFSRFGRYPVTPAGRFHEQELDGLFTRTERHPFILHAEGKVAGFAMVDHPIDSYFTTAKGVTYMAEFFVLTAYQGRGVGAQAAAWLFDHFPGQWEVYEMLPNVNAQHFWRKVIGRYTSGRYTEATTPNQKGIIQSFVSVGKR
jgi:predicted acetyltransferase